MSVVPRPRCWRDCCCARGMSFARAVDRARSDFLDRPGLELTVPQAVHLWRLGLDDCRPVIDALVDAGFLKWTTRRTIRRAEQFVADPGRDPAHPPAPGSRAATPL